jgi:hypothetical protein
MEAIAFYHKLGDLGRSPVWTPEDVQSIELATALKTGGVLLVGALVFGGIYMFMKNR